MVFKSIREKLLKAKAKAHGMTVPELKRYMAKRKVEKRKFKAELRRKEQEEKAKFEKWKIKQKYKQKRKQAKKGKGSGFLEIFGGSTSQGEMYDPLGILGPQKQKRKRKKRRKRS